MLASRTKKDAKVRKEGRNTKIGKLLPELCCPLESRQVLLHALQHTLQRFSLRWPDK